MTDPTPNAPVAALIAEARDHELKCWPRYFAAVRAGTKPFELRKNDRDYRVGDVLRLREWRVGPHGYGGEYSGEEETRVVTYVLHGGEPGTVSEAVADGYVIMGLEQQAMAHDRAVLALVAERDALAKDAGAVLLAFHDWPAHDSAFANGERRRALDMLADRAIGAAATEGRG